MIQKHFNHNLIALPKLDRIDGESGRLYRLPDGSKVPSVTTVLGWAKKDSLVEWRKKVGEDVANKIANSAANRGTKVHAVCEDYLHNKEIISKDLDILTYDMFNSIKHEVDEIDNVLGIELQLFSEHLGLAGTVDCIADNKGKRSIIDFMTSTKPKRLEWIDNYFMQTAIYAVMYEERTGTPVNNLVVIIAIEGGVSQVFVQKRDQWIGKAIDVINSYYDYHGLTRGRVQA